MRRVALITLVTLFLAPAASADWTFVRGDFDGDAAHDLADAISLLALLFLGGAPPPCLDAADVDDDGALALPDAIHLLDHMFVSGVPLPAPYPACGVDPSDDALDCIGPVLACPAASVPYDPPWSLIAPTNTTAVNHDPFLSDEANGAVLAAAIAALTPGDRLEIGTGVYSVNQWFNINLEGTASAPIWIVAAAGEIPVITRPNANQNCINIGNPSAGGTTRYLCLRGLEITGGDTIVKLYSCSNLWIDDCHIHDGSGACVAANSEDTDHLYITRNEIHGGGGTAEGLYLGANNSAKIMTDSIIALNHIYDCYGSQGDGIEVKQGSHSNLIAENLVHDCNYPCIIAYGTDGNPPNIIERNICYGSNDNTMQVQGEAIVRNNLVIAGAGSAFQSHDHQGLSTNLIVVHNTFVNSGRCANLSSWNDRLGMVWANNACYSETAEALRFPNGSAGVILAGNVVVGSVVGAGGGYVAGNGLEDFVDVTWDGAQRDAHLSPASALAGAAADEHATTADIEGTARAAPHSAGCYHGP